MRKLETVLEDSAKLLGEGQKAFDLSLDGWNNIKCLKYFLKEVSKNSTNFQMS